MKNNLAELWKLLYSGSIPVNKALVKKLGTAEAVLFAELVSRYMYFSKAGRLDHDGFFYNSQAMLKDGTGLGRRSQERIIAELVAIGLIEVKHLKGKALRFKVDVTKSKELIYHVQNGQGSHVNHVQNGHTTEDKSDIPPCPNSTSNNGFNNNLNNKGDASADKDNVTAIIDHYRKKFKFHTGQEPHIVNSDYILLKSVIRQRGLVETKELLNSYFDNADKFIRERGYTISIFSKSLNSLLAAKSGIEPSKPIEHYTKDEKVAKGFI